MILTITEHWGENYQMKHSMLDIPNIKRSPLKAIRAYGLQCVGGSTEAVRKCIGQLCNGDQGICALHPYRFDKGAKSGVLSNLTPVKAIAKNCLWCSGGSANERRLCPSQSCPLKAFRLGRNPYITEKKKESTRNAPKGELYMVANLSGAIYRVGWTSGTFER